MLVAIEGIDGSGKGTQTRLLFEEATQRGFSVAVFSFPRYGLNAFSRVVARYLNGEFGGVGQVPPEFAALLYAGDRFATKDSLLSACTANDIVICDRYVPSNLAHQAAKVSIEERQDFINWLMSIEYGIYAMPRPDITVLLNISVPIAQKLVLRKKLRDYTTSKADIHEADADYLIECQEVFRHLVYTDKEDNWVVVPELDTAGQLRSPTNIGQDVLDVVLRKSMFSGT